MQPDQIKKFEVFVTPLYDGNLNDALGDPFNLPDLDQIRDIVDQLFDGLKQLKQADVCHNDIKPANILYRLVGNKFEIRVADFGQCNKRGGTPGWTAPIFARDRQPGKEDMFSMGMIILRVLCENQNLFYALRDNWVSSYLPPSVKRSFNNLPEIKLAKKMMNLDNKLTIEDAKYEWELIKPNIQIIEQSRLVALGVPADSLQLQYTHSR